MLSRVADSLYWMSRYLERAEHTARLIDVSLNMMLEQTPEEEQLGWERLMKSLRVTVDCEPNDAYAITQAVTFDDNNSASLAACITAARENARQVREEISSEMWEHMNRLYLQIKRTSMQEIWYAEPHAFFAGVKSAIHLFQGITDSTMTHSEGWYFIRVGRSIERATATAALLDVHFRTYIEEAQSNDGSTHAPLDYLGWVGLLKFCAAFEAYCKVYTANIQPNSIAEFLLLNAESPRSVRFAANVTQSALQAIGKITHIRNAGRAERLAGRLRAALEYDQIDEIMSEDPHSYLENIQHQCGHIHSAIYQVYIAYPIDIALPS